MKLSRITAPRPLSPESVASLAAAWDALMEGSIDHLTDLSKMILSTRP